MRALLTEEEHQMTHSALIKATLISSVMLLAGTSRARGPGDKSCCAAADPGACDTDAACCVAQGMPNAPVIELSPAAATQLRRMREEEKLAHDVYLAMFDKWGAKVFNIRNAEQRHMNAMKNMLDRFTLQDPITDNTPGVFTLQIHTDLYAQLVEAGSISLIDALKVGAKIEELDLTDLRVAADGVDDPVLIKVYANLQRATRNHLRAFAAQIKLNGGNYTAEHLTQTEFDAIADSDFERGNRALQAQGNRQGKGEGKAQGQGKGQDKKADKACPLCAD